MSASDRPGQAAAAIEALGDSPSPSDARRDLAEFDAKDLAAALVSRGGGGGASTAVSCLLARDAPFDIRLDAADGSVLWDALYDNLWDQNPLAAIPDGLGLTFSFDGSADLIVPTEAGVWSFSYAAVRAQDTTWVGSFQVSGLGLNWPWVQPTSNGVPLGTAYMAAAATMSLPAGTQIANDVAPVAEATENPYTCTQVYLTIVRLA